MSSQPTQSEPAKSAAPAPKAEKNAYKDSLNLPRTAFPMEAKLVQNEPKRFASWEEGRLYEKLLAARSAGRRWVLHDGPPFANGDIHIGHLINKTLKDIILRFRSMQGYQTPYVPGWDCHGLPIEHKIQEELQKKHGRAKFREMSTVDVRRECHAYAKRFADAQCEQFKRLGILGEWGDPYLTMKPEYEAATLEVFARFVEAGLVYKQLKPVHWSIANQTALADAELEYQTVTDTSVFVEFPLAEALDGHADVHLVIWTTTPWTLPANLAVAVNPAESYALVRYERAGQSRTGLVAAALVDRVFKGRADVSGYAVTATRQGEQLVGLKYRHPFMDKTGTVVPAEYVSVSAPAEDEPASDEEGHLKDPGTGLVHTAPGHGEDDYLTGIANSMEIYCPVLANGRFDESVPPWLRGLIVWDANAVIINKLSELGVLFAQKPITHSYPHDWRSRTPTIFRATEQWFVALDKPFVVRASLGRLPGHEREFRPDASPRTLRERAQSAVAGEVQFVPEWGRHRIAGMLQSRPDWCISRQRAWGLPIPVFYNDKGQPLLTVESVRAVARHVRHHGSDEWFTCAPEQLLGADFVYPPGFEPGKLRKESDIFDVWFESGSSWHAVLQTRSYLQFPAELYLEGSDQHRGWFQLSLLPSLGVTGRPPFKAVLTHGFVVKPDGKKVSKRDPEYVTALDEINRHGADLLRLWCSSVDYQGDIPTSPQVLKEFGDKYRKIRNIIRYLLSNLADFDPRVHAQPVLANSLDGWANDQLDQLVRNTVAAYDTYQIHRVFRLLHDFCAVQVSAVYGNAMKDRLYCEAPSSPLRRQTQTVMHRIVLALTKLLAPICVYTADEAWSFIAHKPPAEADAASVHLALLPSASSETVSDEQRLEWKMLMDLRGQALAQIDKLTRQIGKYKALDAEVIYHVTDPELRRKLQAYGPDLEDLVGAGCWSFGDNATGSAITVEVVDRRDTYKACARSWKRRPNVGTDAQYPDLSRRDANAMRAISVGRP